MILLALMLAAASPDGTAGVWRDGESVVLVGKIDDRAAAAVDALIRDAGPGKVRRLVVTSRGGAIEASVGLAELVQQRGLDVEVRDYCLSACASYVFVAGRRRFTAEGSLVSFHNTSSSYERVARLLKLPQVETAVADRARRERALYVRAGVSEQLLYEPEIAIGPVCFTVQPSGADAKEKGLMFSRASFWTPSAERMRAAGAGFQGDWPATPQDLAARMTRHPAIRARAFMFGSGRDAAAIDQGYAAVVQCSPAFLAAWKQANVRPADSGKATP